MKSLKKLLLWRFVLIVVAHSVVLLLAVYGITLFNIKKSVEWDLKRIEARIVEHARLDSDLSSIEELFAVFNSSEEREVRISVYDQNKKLLYGREVKADFTDKSFNSYFLGYKKWEFERVTYDEEKWFVARVRVNLDFVDDTLWIMGICLPLILLPALIFANRSFKTVVDPVRDISSTLKNIEKGDLKQRVEGKADNEEISTLIERMNEALSALEDSFLHSERFNANAAHELKTPLAALRGEIDVCLQQDRTVDEYEDCLVKCQDEIRHLDEVLKILLLISTPGNSIADTFTEVDYEKALEENLELLKILADQKGINLTVKSEKVLRKGSQELLKRAFFNIVENAIKYSPENSSVSLSLSNGGFVVSDSAPKIPEDKREDILKPFQRLDAGQSGAGLGLSLVKWICDRHNMKLEFNQSSDGNVISLKW